MTFPYSYADLAGMIDHSLLHPTMTDAELEAGCALAAKYEVASVCIKPYYVRRAVELLRGTQVRVGCVIGFPHGNSSTEVKRFETAAACRDGATEGLQQAASATASFTVGSRRPMRKER